MLTLLRFLAYLEPPKAKKNVWVNKGSQMKFAEKVNLSLPFPLNLDYEHIYMATGYRENS